MSYVSATARIAAIAQRIADPLGVAAVRPGGAVAATPIERMAAAVAPAMPAVSPIPTARRTQGFGATGFHLAPATTRDGVRYDHYHPGVDLSAAEGTPVGALAAGRVTFAGRDSSGSMTVKIRHADGSESLYGHLQRDLPVQAGDHVTAGMRIGDVGMTGLTTGPHLHLALKNATGRPVDPTPAMRTGDIAAAFAADEVLSTFERLPREDAYRLRDAAARSGVDPYLIAAIADSGLTVRAEEVAEAITATGSAGGGLSAIVAKTGANPDRVAAVLSRWSALLGGPQT